MTESAASTSAVSSRRRWAARLAILTVVALLVLLLTYAGLRGIVFMAVMLGGVLAVVFAAAWWFLSHSGVVRLAAALLALAAVVTLVVGYVRAELLWLVVVCALLGAVAIAAGRTALTDDRAPAPAAEYDTPPPRTPFLIMNPRSGGGKVTRFGLDQRARDLGATVVLFGEQGTTDVAALARQAVADGADLLGVAGGDGTQALVAEVAAEHDVPFMVIPAGTRNHFALDLGLDRADPAASLAALTDGVELKVDLGRVGGRTFVNNASFGAYAAVVRSPAYRNEKVRTALEELPRLLATHGGPALRVQVDGQTLVGPQSVLVSNNPYGAEDDISGLGRRYALDTGVLGVLAVTISGAAQAAGLARGRRSTAIWRGSATECVLDADTPTLPVGVDGESLELPTPVRCTIRPGALRVRLPRDRPGVPRPAPRVDWLALLHLALPVRSASGS